MNAPIQAPRPSAPQPPAEDDAAADLIDYAVLRNWGRFVLGSFRRHRMLGLVCFAAVAGGAIMAAIFMPRTYVASTKLLTHTTEFMSSLSNPYRGAQDEGPTRAARERVLSRESLEKIIGQTNLIEEWQRTRNPLLNLKDKMVQLVSGRWSSEDWMDIMIGILEKRLTVSSDEGTVEMRVEWPEATMARRIVETAQQNFLETRHVSEVAAISETIGILEIHASQTQTAIDEALANLQRVIDQRTRGKGSVPAPPSASPRPTPRGPDGAGADVSQLRFMLRAKQRAIADLEDFRSRQLTELRATLEQQRIIYNKSHPVILELEQRIDSLQKDSPQLLTLKRDEADLLKEIEAKGGNREERSGGDSAVLTVRRTPTSMETSLANLAPDLDRDPTVTVAQDQLRVAMARYQELLMRVEAARLELDTTRAAFKYRFSVVNPAQTPRKPSAPNVPLILIAGLLGALLCAFAACAGLDLWRQTLCETWQIERQLRLPVLSSIKSSSLG